MITRKTGKSGTAAARASASLSADRCSKKRSTSHAHLLGDTHNGITDHEASFSHHVDAIAADLGL